MERQVKERLIGAAVLMAAAVILIPEMLSGPKRPATASAPARAGEVPMKTYTIDLNRSPGASASAPAVSEQVPPAEVVENSPPQETAVEPMAPQATNERPPASVSTPETPAQTIPESAPVKPAPPPSSSKPASIVPEMLPPAPPSQEPERPTPAVKSAPKPLAPVSTAPTSRQWAVQLGSFASKTGAERLAKEWEDRGQQAFVMPVKSGNNTLYRVRLGPFAERAVAEEALRKVGNRIAGAAVVAHP